ncbi:winged helix-turn-helix transcriptional regulator [Mycobacterium sp. 134]|uniref:winged helix-turn-helix transcriptional regulator n=1 Tax=unclassified Mycobacterium TaxID=2642494 RepID=UPI0007FB7ED8|nr:helix-turn-helix domain-containing protein [Mycobacterium sp. E802]OBG80431.1 transcriptional regulator [Mycobacterium sp. E802]
MPRGKPAQETLCPIARAAAVIGDRWSIVVLREMFLGTTRFDDLQVQTGATAQMLAARLKQLQSEGLVARHLYSERPARHDYHLTEMGRGFLPVILALRAWGEIWQKDPTEPLAVHIRHQVCGTELDLNLVCPTCKVIVSHTDIDSDLSKEFAAERARRRLSP